MAATRDQPESSTRDVPEGRERTHRHGRRPNPSLRGVHVDLPDAGEGRREALPDYAMRKVARGGAGLGSEANVEPVARTPESPKDGVAPANDGPVADVEFCVRVPNHDRQLLTSFRAFDTEMEASPTARAVDDPPPVVEVIKL